jgi:hypothetical protein
MKKALIIALVCINVALVLALVFTMNQQPAKAQGGAGADYLVISAKVATNIDAVFVIDVAKQRMLALEPDPNKKYKVNPYSGRKLKTDFKIKDTD